MTNWGVEPLRLTMDPEPPRPRMEEVERGQTWRYHDLRGDVWRIERTDDPTHPLKVTRDLAHG